MTTPTPLPASETYSAELLPRDKFRTLIAVAIVLLTIGGWIYVVMSPTDRSALSAQTRLWWIEQITTFVLAVVCIAIALRKRSFLTLAFWLTIYSLIFKVMRWYFEFRAGEYLVPIALILYALFIWRLHLARRGVAGEGQVVAV
jgi:DMSO reductase anchor subunit